MLGMFIIKFQITSKKYPTRTDPKLHDPTWPKNILKNVSWPLFCSGQVRGNSGFWVALQVFKWYMVFIFQYYLSGILTDPRPPIPPRVMASSAMELQLGVFGFLPTTHKETNANKMRPWSSQAVRHFTRVYLHAQTLVHTHLTNHGYFDNNRDSTKISILLGILANKQNKNHVHPNDTKGFKMIYKLIMFSEI